MMSYRYIHAYLLHCCHRYLHKYKYSRIVLDLIISKYVYLNKRYYYKYKRISVNERTTFPHNALWSPPRSGNHWVRFITEYLTGHPTCGYNINPADKPVFAHRYRSLFHPLAHVSGKLPYILYKAHSPYLLLDGSTIILLVRNFNELVVRYALQEADYSDYIPQYIEVIKGYDEFSGAKVLIYYEDLLLNPEREVLRIKHFLGASDSRYKTFMKHYDYYTYLSKHPLRRTWDSVDSDLDFYFWRKKSSKEDSLVKEHIQIFNQLLAKPEYQQVKPYIARYM